MKKVDYGNWVPVRMLLAIAACMVVSTGLLVLAITLTHGWLWITLAAVLLCAATVFFCYMFAYHRAFSYAGGRMMERVYGYVMKYLHWDGQGRLLDVGCGSGALTIFCAKTLPAAQCTGIDYWGIQWGYGLDMCNQNAQLEKVGDRCHFQRGDANHLDFEDETFDAVVSNFVYHEVRNNSDKEALIMETLRVLKKGGVFALHDLLGQKSVYGDFHKVVEHLKEQGISEIHYIENTECKIPLPTWMRLPGMMKNTGLIYGRK